MNVVFSNVEFLGQGGFRITWGDSIIYLDPYLSDSVRQLDAPDLVRQLPPPLAPDQVNDADWVLITHAHIDHCDPHTLPALSSASPTAQFLGPSPVLQCLEEWNIQPSRLHPAEETWRELLPGLNLRAVPAAHPEIERDADGNPACVGYVLEGNGAGRSYFAGDTGVCTELLETLKELAPIDMACIPVNEQNYFRQRRGIIGNMSVREAMQMAEEIGAARLFPCHWDMFAANSAYPEEIRLIYDKMSPRFELLSAPFTLFAGEH